MGRTLNGRRFSLEGHDCAKRAARGPLGNETAPTTARRPVGAESAAVNDPRHLMSLRLVPAQAPAHTCLAGASRPRPTPHGGKIWINQWVAKTPANISRRRSISPNA